MKKKVKKMKNKIFLIGLVLGLVFSIGFTFAVGPSIQEQRYWDTISPPTQVTVPIKENSVPFNITITRTSWDISSLKGTVTISFPVYAPAGLASCTVQSKTIHLSYSGDQKVWASSTTSCSIGKKTMIQTANGAVQATIVNCPDIEVGDGVTTINVTCRDKAGQSSTASYKFIIDKMAPYIVPGTINYEKYSLGTTNSNFDPRIYFDVEDLSSNVMCIINFSTSLGANYSYLCVPTSADGGYFDIKTFHMVCSPETAGLPIGFLSYKGGTVKCIDSVGNSYEYSTKSLGINLMNVTGMNKDQVINLVTTMCRDGWLYTPQTTLNTQGIFSDHGDSPAKDNQPLSAFVMVDESGDNTLTTKELKTRTDENLKQLAEIRNCVGGLVACSGLCALDIFTMKGASTAAKESAKEVAEEETEKMLREADKQLEDLSEKADELKKLGVSDEAVGKIDELSKQLENVRDLIKEGKIDEAADVLENARRSMKELNSELDSIAENLGKQVDDIQGEIKALTNGKEIDDYWEGVIKENEGISDKGMKLIEQRKSLEEQMEEIDQRITKLEGDLPNIEDKIKEANDELQNLVGSQSRGIDDILTNTRVGSKNVPWESLAKPDYVMKAEEQLKAAMEAEDAVAIRRAYKRMIKSLKKWNAKLGKNREAYKANKELIAKLEVMEKSLDDKIRAVYQLGEEATNVKSEISAAYLSKMGTASQLMETDSEMQAILTSVEPGMAQLSEKEALRMETMEKIAQLAEKRDALTAKQSAIKSVGELTMGITDNLEGAISQRKIVLSNAEALNKINKRMYKLYSAFGRHGYLSAMINPWSLVIHTQPATGIMQIAFTTRVMQPIFRRTLYYFIKKTPYQYNYEQHLGEVLKEYYYIRQPKTYEKGNPLWDMYNMLFDAITGVLPCGDLVVAVKQMVAMPDYPDLIVIYDGSATPGSEDNAEIIQPAHTYLIQTRIERIDMSSGWPPVAEQLGECLFGCPDYACVVTIVPNQNEY